MPYTVLRNSILSTWNFWWVGPPKLNPPNMYSFTSSGRSKVPMCMAALAASLVWSSWRSAKMSPIWYGHLWGWWNQRMAFLYPGFESKWRRIYHHWKIYNFLGGSLFINVAVISWPKRCMLLRVASLSVRSLAWHRTQLYPRNRRHWPATEKLMPCMWCPLRLDRYYFGKGLGRPEAQPTAKAQRHLKKLLPFLREKILGTLFSAIFSLDFSRP